MPCSSQRGAAGATPPFGVVRVPRIGLVLGGGGVIGNAYLSGVLEGIRRVSGWDPGQAQITVGTSAGSVSGALTALGVPTEAMYRYVQGEPLTDGPAGGADDRVPWDGRHGRSVSRR